MDETNKVEMIVLIHVITDKCCIVEQHTIKESVTFKKSIWFLVQLDLFNNFICMFSANFKLIKKSKYFNIFTTVTKAKGIFLFQSLKVF